MKWEIIGALGEFIGGVVVILSLVYFGAQLRQSNRHAGASAQIAWMDAWNRVLNDLVSDEYTQSAIREGLNDFEHLPKPKQALFHMRIGAIVNHWVLAGELQEKGLIRAGLFEDCTDFVVSLLSSPGGLQYWERDAEMTPRGNELLELIKSGQRDVLPIGEILPWWSSDDG